MIVGAPGVARDAALARLRGGGLDSTIVEGQHEQAARAVEHVPRVRVGLGASRQILHLAGVPGREPLLKAAEALRSDRRTDAGRLEAQAAGCGLELMRQRGTVHAAMIELN